MARLIVRQSLLSAGRRKAEDGRRKTEDGRRKTEDGRRKTEDGRRKTKLAVRLLSMSVCLLMAANVSGQEPSELQPVEWILGANTQFTPNAGGITKHAGGSTTWNAGAVSAQRILRDGRLEFTAIPGSQAMLGLSLTSANDSYAEIDYAIYVKPNGASTTSGLVEVRQNGTSIVSLGSYAATTVFVIRRTGSQIQYLMDGVIKYTSTVVSTGKLLVDSSFYKHGSEITSANVYTGDLDLDGMPDAWEKSHLPPNHGWNDVLAFEPDDDPDDDDVSNLIEFEDGSNPTDALSYLSPVVWGSHINTTSVDANGGLQRGTAVAAWNADAVSSKSILQDGKLTFRVSAGSYLSVGLTYANDSRAATDIEYRFIIRSDNTVDVVRPEASTTAVAVGVYTSETIFTIQRVNGKVQFLKDGVVMNTSTTISSGPLYVDCSLYSPSTKIDAARLYTGDLDADGLPDSWELFYLSQGADIIDLTDFVPTGTSADPDDDDLDNLQEFYDGTHPFQALSYPSGVVWTPSTNAAVVAGSVGGVKKTAGGSTTWNADAVGSKLVFHTGKLAYNLKAGSHLVLGFTLANDNRSYTDLEYGTRSGAEGTAQVYEGGTSKFEMGDWDENTRFAIRRVAGTIEYMKNGVVYYTSAVPVSASLLVDSSFYVVNSEVTSARLYTGDLDEDMMPDDWEIEQLIRQAGPNAAPPTYTQLLNDFTAGGNADSDGLTNLDEYHFGTDPLQQVIAPDTITWDSATHVNTAVVAGTPGGLKKIAGTTGSYNADAVGIQTLTGDGGLHFTAAPSGTLAVGLTYADNSNADTDLEYAFVLTSTGASVQRPESSTDLATGSYTASTVFGIRRSGSTVSYTKDGVVVYTSTTASTGTLFVDCSIATLNHQIAAAYLSDGDQDNDGLPDAWELQYLPLNAPLAQVQALLPSADQDDDGVSLLDEYLHGSSDALADTDDDGMTDAWEILHGFAVADASNASVDADSDGLTNQNEFLQGTQPLVWDTDGDGIPDGYEVINGLLPLDQGDGLADHDGDLIPNLWEYGRGTLANDAASLPSWDAIVQPSGLEVPSQKLFSTLAAAVASLPADPSYRALIKILRGAHSNTALEAAGQTPRTVAFIAEGGATRLNRSEGGEEGAVFLRNGLSPLALKGESLFSRVIFDGGPGVKVEPEANTIPAVSFINCVFRNVQHLLDSGTANHGSVITNLGGNISFEHCTIHRCHTSYLGASGPPLANLAGTLRIKNSVIWNDIETVSPISTLVAGAVTLQNSLVQGGMSGSINLNPELTAKAYFTINSTACFASGGATRLLVDLHGQARPSSSPSLGAVQSINSDGDSLPDWWERWWFADTALSDNSKTNPEHPTLTLLNAYLDEDWNPVPLLDHDGDGLHDPWELEHWGDLSAQDAAGDADDDGVSNLNELLAGSNPTRYPGDEDTDADGLKDILEQTHGSNPTLADTDGDGLSDGWEVASGYSPLAVSANTQDLDGDGVSADDEFQQGTYDNNPDSDSDGLGDGEDAVPYDYAFDVPRSAVSNLIPVDLGVCTWDNSLRIAKDGSCVWTKTNLYPPVYNLWTPERGLQEVIGLDPTTPNAPDALYITDIAEDGFLLGTTELADSGPSGTKGIGVTWNTKTGVSFRYFPPAYHLDWDDNHVQNIMKGPGDTVVTQVYFGKWSEPDVNTLVNNPDSNGYNSDYPQGHVWYNQGLTTAIIGIRDQLVYPGVVKQVDSEGNGIWAFTGRALWSAQHVLPYRFGVILQQEVRYADTWSLFTIQDMATGTDYFDLLSRTDGYEYTRYLMPNATGSASFNLDYGVQYVWANNEWWPWAGPHVQIRDMSETGLLPELPYIAGEKVHWTERTDIADVPPPLALLPEEYNANFESTGAYIWTQRVNNWRAIYTKGGPGKQQLRQIDFCNRRAQAIVSEGTAWDAPVKLWANGKVHDLSPLLPANFGNQWSNVNVRSLTSSGAIVATATSLADGLTHLISLVAAELIPGSESQVSADDHSTNIVFQLGSEDGSAAGVDGSLVEWQIVSGGGSLSETVTEVNDGLTAVKLNTSTLAGNEHVIKARLKRLGSYGGFIVDNGSWIVSPEIEVVAGNPHTFSFTKSKAAYRSDGTDTTEITVQITDQFGNLVEDGTPVSWGVDQTPTPPFVSRENVTTNGQAKAVLRAPLYPTDQVVTCSAGDKQASTTVTVERVTGALSGVVDLDIGAGQSSVITAAVAAADGTPVYWSTSNGEITQQTSVNSGSTSATLNATHGRLGKVVVTATIGDRLLFKEGEFTSSTGLAMGAEHPVLIADASSNGVSTPVFDHGIARSIPYFASTPVRIKGPANGLAHLTIEGSVPVAAWPFNSAVGNVTSSQIGGHDMSLSNAVIDPVTSFEGGASLRFQGNGSGTVSNHTQLHFTDQLNALLWVRPELHTAATLATKAGSWQINELADGRVQASVSTDEGTYTATSASALPLGQWTALEVDFRFNRLQIKFNGQVDAQVSAGGEILVTASAISVGNSFVGNLDRFTLRARAVASSIASVTGLGAGDTLQLDANGEGSFTVTSNGLNSGGTSIRIFGDVNPKAEAEVGFVSLEVWNATHDAVWSFFGADPQTSAGTIANIVGGVLVVGDLGSVVKNLWRMSGGSAEPVNKVELVLGGLGVVTTLAELTGVGISLDAAVAAVKTLAIRIGTDAVALKFLWVFCEQLYRVVTTGEKFGAAELSVPLKMVDDVPVADAFKLFMHDEALLKVVTRATDKLAHNAEAFYQGVTRAVSTHGAEVGAKMVQTFDGLSEEVLEALKNTPAAQLDDAMDGLGRVVSKGINPEAIRRVLDNPHVYGTQYNRVRLLEDLDELALSNVKGIAQIVDALKSESAAVRGVRYELEGAAHLIRNGDEVVELTRKIRVGSLRTDTTDIDVVVRATNGKLIYYQFKSSRVSFGTFEETQAWVAKALKDLPAGSTYDQIRFAVPEISAVPPGKVKPWFESLNPKIIVNVIPITP